MKQTSEFTVEVGQTVLYGNCQFLKIGKVSHLTSTQIVLDNGRRFWKNRSFHKEIGGFESRNLKRVASEFDIETYNAVKRFHASIYEEKAWVVDFNNYQKN